MDWAAMHFRGEKEPSVQGLSFLRNLKQKLPCSLEAEILLRVMGTPKFHPFSTNP